MAPTTTPSSARAERADGSSRPRKAQSSTQTQRGDMERKTITVSMLAVARARPLEYRDTTKLQMYGINVLTFDHVKSSASSSRKALPSWMKAMVTRSCKTKMKPGSGT
jgi:hypothetical protein